MEYLIAASLVISCVAVRLVYQFKRRKRVGCLVFRKRRLSQAKRRRHTLLDHNRGKVIPFPSKADSLRQSNGQPDS